MPAGCLPTLSSNQLLDGRGSLDRLKTTAQHTPGKTLELVPAWNFFPHQSLGNQSSQTHPLPGNCSPVPPCSKGTSVMLLVRVGSAISCNVCGWCRQTSASGKAGGTGKEGSLASMEIMAWNGVTVGRGALEVWAVYPHSNCGDRCCL